MSMYGQLGLGFSGDSFEPGTGMHKSKVAVPTEITHYMPPEITVCKIISLLAKSRMQIFSNVI